MARAETAITVALQPREIDALLVAAHIVMDSLPAENEAALERAATEHILFATRGRLPLKDYGIPTWCRCDRVLRQDRVAAAG
jgi:hypothetical protein